MWRNTGITPKLFMFDVRSFLFLLPFLLHMAKATFLFGLIGMLGFFALNRFGVGFRQGMRVVRKYLFGGVRPRRDTRTFRTRCWE